MFVCIFYLVDWYGAHTVYVDPSVWTLLRVVYQRSSGSSWYKIFFLSLASVEGPQKLRQLTYRIVWDPYKLGQGRQKNYYSFVRFPPVREHVLVCQPVLVSGDIRDNEPVTCSQRPTGTFLSKRRDKTDHQRTRGKNNSPKTPITNTYTRDLCQLNPSLERRQWIIEILRHVQWKDSESKEKVFYLTTFVYLPACTLYWVERTRGRGKGEWKWKKFIVRSRWKLFIPLTLSSPNTRYSVF